MRKIVKFKKYLFKKLWVYKNWHSPVSYVLSSDLQGQNQYRKSWTFVAENKVGRNMYVANRLQDEWI